MSKDVLCNMSSTETQENSQEKVFLQGDPNHSRPIPGRNEICFMGTEDSIYKHYLFKNYLKSFVFHKRLFGSE